MIPFVLPNVLLIAEDCTTQEFCDLILPELKPVFKIQDPIQVGCFLKLSLFTFEHYTCIQYLSSVLGMGIQYEIRNSL